MDTKLYVGNLSYATTEEQLRELFSQAGTVVSVALISDRDTGRSRGFAFVEMQTQAEAQKAINLFNNYQLDNRTLTVNVARPRKETGYSAGDRGGGYERGRSPRDRRGGSRRY
jgi:RNA recognition motif-containing protein